MSERTVASSLERGRVHPRFAPVRTIPQGEIVSRPHPPPAKGAAPPVSVLEAPKPQLLDQVREAILTRHYSIRTEETYVQWIKRFALFHDGRHPRDQR